MVIDYRRNESALPATEIKGETVEIASTHTYLCTETGNQPNYAKCATSQSFLLNGTRII